MEEKYLTINDVCDQLNVSRQSVNNWRRSGMLKAENINGRISFAEVDVKALSKKRTPPGRKRKDKN